MRNKPGGNVAHAPKDPGVLLARSRGPDKRIDGALRKDCAGARRNVGDQDRVTILFILPFHTIRTTLSGSSERRIFPVHAAARGGHGHLPGAGHPVSDGRP